MATLRGLTLHSSKATHYCNNMVHWSFDWICTSLKLGDRSGTSWLVSRAVTGRSMHCIKRTKQQQQKLSVLQSIQLILVLCSVIPSVQVPDKFHPNNIQVCPICQIGQGPVCCGQWTNKIIKAFPFLVSQTISWNHFFMCGLHRACMPVHTP